MIHEENIKRIIYVWRRYKGTRITKGKSYSFADIDILEQMIVRYWLTYEDFDVDTPLEWVGEY